jgi:hypothetical protein
MGPISGRRIVLLPAAGLAGAGPGPPTASNRSTVTIPPSETFSVGANSSTNFAGGTGSIGPRLVPSLPLPPAALAAAALAVLAFAVLAAPAASASDPIGGETTLAFDAQVLADLGIALASVDVTASPSREEGVAFRLDPTGSRAALDAEAGDFDLPMDVALIGLTSLTQAAREPGGRIATSSTPAARTPTASART